MSSIVARPRFSGRRTIMIPALLAAATLLLGIGISPAHALGAPLYKVSQTQTGLVASDPLTATLSQSQLAASSFWTFGGDAIGENAPYAFTEDSSGLHIGVQATPAHQYAGFYGLHIADAMLAHAVVTAPSRTVPSGYPNAGLYVQTGGANVDYIVCGATTASYGTYWGAALAVGNPNQAFQYVPIWYDNSANQPLTRACTIVTNGQNYLAIYVDGSEVYQASNLVLGYQEPFQFFLETQTSYTGAMFMGTYQNFYLTSSGSVTVTGMPNSSTAEIVSPSGQVLASSPESSGTATLPIGQYNMPLIANVVITELGLQVGSTTSPVSIWGGDSYSVSLLGLLGGGLVASNQASSSPSSVISAAPPAPVSSATSAAGPPSSISPSTSTGAIATPITSLSMVAVSAMVISKRESEHFMQAGSQEKRMSLLDGKEDR